MMYAITGVTGQVGRAVAEQLLAAGLPVRAVARDARKAAPWAERGCGIAIADYGDIPALTAAFAGTEGAFIVIPPNYDPKPGHPDALAMFAALRAALGEARPAKIVVLSTIGATAPKPSLLSWLGVMEREFSALPAPLAFLRAGWFMENAASDLPGARETGIIPSFLAPLDKPIRMVAVADIGRVAAELLRESWRGRRIIELEGQRPVSPNDVAAAFSKILGRPVRAEIVPRETWAALFRSQGTADPTPRIQMLDGFNEGWVERDNGEAVVVKGIVTLETALRGLVETGP